MTELLSTLFASDKRRNLLLLLLNGPREWEEIKSILKVTSTGMLPQIKILEEENLIQRDGKEYTLTPMGRILAVQMEPLLKTTELFEKHKAFWDTHALDVIPDDILLDIRDLGDYRLLENPDEYIFDINPFLNNIRSSQKIQGISHTVHPKFPEFFLSLANNGVHSSLILTPAVFSIVRENYRDMLREWLGLGNTELYVSPTDLKFSFVVTDTYFSISLFFNNGMFDAKHDVISMDPSAREWGGRVFDHFRGISEKIDSLD